MKPSNFAAQQQRMLAREKAIKEDPSGPTLDDTGPDVPTGGGEGPATPQAPSGPTHGAALPAHRQAWRQEPSREPAHER